MDIASNPFFILRVGTQHTRQDITDAAENLMLSEENEEYAKAKAVLTHPRNRIGAEIGWLPGVPPKLAQVLLDRINTAPQSISEVLPKLPPLARCNMAAMLLHFHRAKDASLTEWLHFMAKAFDEIDLDQLTEALNADRAVAGFSPIPSSAALEDALAQRRSYLADTMRDTLDKTLAPDFVMTALIEKATQNGTSHGAILIEDLVDKYQLEVQKYLDQLEAQIVTILDFVQSAPKFALEQKLQLIDEKVRNWGAIARPIQIMMFSKGLDDEASSRLANTLRRSAVFLANEQNRHAEATKITSLMAQVFKELPLLSQSLNEDMSALKDILKNKEAHSEEWGESIALELSMGHLIKDKFSINASRIKYNNTSIAIKAVDRFRWGVVVKFVNGARSSASYGVWLGSPSASIAIECTKAFQREDTAEQNFNLIQEKLWLAIGQRLFHEALARITAGEKIRYGNVVLGIDGVTVWKRPFFAYREHLVKWRELVLENGPGSFIVSSRKNRSARAELAYREVDNVVILESVLRFLLKDGNLDRLDAGIFA